MNKLYYISNIRLPTEKAHGIQIMEMCSAFSAQGVEVELIVPRRGNTIKTDPFEYYNMKPEFNIKYLPTLDLVRFGWIGFWIQQLTFSESVSWYLFMCKGYCYTRDPLIALMLKLVGKNVMWEGHRGETNILVRLLIWIGLKMVMITNGLKHLYVGMGAESKKIMVAPDAVDIHKFGNVGTKEESRIKSGFGPEKVILYTGHLYGWKGAGTLAEAAKFLPTDASVNFVGGTDSDLISFREKYENVSNIKIWGKKPHQDIPFYVGSADILVIPNSAKEDISKLYTSPMKLFEYMASGRPIVASNLPSIREILDESTTSFFTPDDPQDLARVLKSALNNLDEQNQKAEKAFKLVHDYSWDNRAKHILEFFKNKN